MGVLSSIPIRKDQVLLSSSIPSWFFSSSLFLVVVRPFRPDDSLL